MKGWLAQYNGNWHKIKDIKDSGISAHKEGGGNFYHLEGVQNPVHQSKITDIKEPEHKMNKSKTKTMEIKDLINEHEKLVDTLSHPTQKKLKEEAEEQSKELKSYKKDIKKEELERELADGKIRRVEGKEFLLKDPKARWHKLKKALNHEDAFLDIEKATQIPEKIPQEDDIGSSTVQDQELAQTNDPHEEEHSLHDTTEHENLESTIDPTKAEKLIIQALKDEGYSDVEIAYIVHGQHVSYESLQEDESDNEPKSEI